MTYTKEQCMIASPALNSWIFPTFMRDKQPENWKSMSTSEQFENETFQSLTNQVNQSLSNYERSWAWWQYQGLDSTGKEHLKWWRSRNEKRQSIRWLFGFKLRNEDVACTKHLRSQILEEREENLAFYPTDIDEVEP